MTEMNSIQEHIVNDERTIPVHLLSGFLGSGKTTLLNHLIQYYKEMNVKTAIVMNELGDVNLDGQFIEGDVPMAEMLSGCICCTIRGDLSIELKELVDEHQPEVVIIESTGAANPMEIMDAITEAALLLRVDLRVIATVVDGPELLERSKKGERTYKLMQDQIRCATNLIVNKSDKLDPEDLIHVQQLVRELNAFAPLTVTVRCVTDLSIFDLDRDVVGASSLVREQYSEEQSRHQHICGANCTHDHEHSHDHEGGSSYISHEHVMTLTHYLTEAVDSYEFEALIRRLPKEVYRAKGIVTFTDTTSRFLFQYAYGEVEFIRITPQAKVNDVAVFIGEHFSKEAVLQELLQLTNR